MNPVIIKHRNVRVQASSAPCADGKSVELLRDGDVVRALQVRCSCGEVTVVEFDYPEPPPTETAPS